VEEGGRIVKVDLPSLWYCLDGRDTAPEEGCIGGCCCVALWGGPEELEVAELAGVDGFLCSGVATWWCPPPPWYPNKSPKSGTHTLSYKFAGTFSREAFAASTSECKTEINPQPDPTAPLCSRARSNGPSFAPLWNIALLFLYLPDWMFMLCLKITDAMQLTICFTREKTQRSCVTFISATFRLNSSNPRYTSFDATL